MPATLCKALGSTEVEDVAKVFLWLPSVYIKNIFIWNIKRLKVDNAFSCQWQLRRMNLIRASWIPLGRQHFFLAAQVHPTQLTAHSRAAKVKTFTEKNLCKFIFVAAGD